MYVIGSTFLSPLEIFNQPMLHHFSCFARRISASDDSGDDGGMMHIYLRIYLCLLCLD